VIEAAGHGPDAFGNALRHVRHARRLSQRGLAELTGVPPSRIARLESGQLSTSLESVMSLYRLLGFSVGLHHLFPCPPLAEHTETGPSPKRQSSERPAQGPTTLQPPPACTDWESDGSVAFVDRAGRAFPAHGELRVGDVPDWLGGKHNWGVECQDVRWWTRRLALHPQHPRSRARGGD
jgi:transcriptional regulator with XRE-family HTH domain